MQRGLFGKLQAKRDFLAHGAPRGFLSAFEPWLHAAVAASKARLGPMSQDAHLTAPIWRFRLGAEICGAEVLGALTPSMDGVGRYFPLAVVFMAEENERFRAPEADAQDDWFLALESLLFLALDAEQRFEDIVAAFDALPAPALEPTPPDAPLLIAGAATARVDDAGFSHALARARAAVEHTRARAAGSFWWTLGGEGYERRALVAAGLPDPALFAAMVTGRFDASFCAKGGETHVA